MALSYNLGYRESISVHPTRRQIFAGKPDSTFPNIWEWLIYEVVKSRQVATPVDPAAWTSKSKISKIYKLRIINDMQFENKCCSQKSRDSCVSAPALVAPFIHTRTLCQLVKSRQVGTPVDPRKREGRRDRLPAMFLDKNWIINDRAQCTVQMSPAVRHFSTNSQKQKYGTEEQTQNTNDQTWSTLPVLKC